MYLEGEDVAVVTDHRPLLQILKSKNELRKNSRVAKCRMLLQQYDLRWFMTQLPIKLQAPDPFQIFEGLPEGKSTMDPVDPCILREPKTLEASSAFRTRGLLVDATSAFPRLEPQSSCATVPRRKGFPHLSRPHQCTGHDPRQVQAG